MAAALAAAIVFLSPVTFANAAAADDAPEAESSVATERAPEAGAVPGSDPFAEPATADLLAYRDELLARAAASNLADDPAWRALLHYREHRFGRGPKSLAEAPDFFLAADGRTNPTSELNATIAGFFDASESARDGQHPQCAFPARFRWLSHRLAFDPQRLPVRPCTRFEEWRASLHPTGISLIFPEAYLNNPASMFGHTLLRVDSDETGARSDLLAYSINFAAETGGDDGLTFAWKGIFGSYPGYFSLLPYYDTVKAYGDWENRDIWEYQLNLSPDEVDMVLRHNWELRGVAFSYYFFDENCSYQLLDLLEVAQPEADLQDKVGKPWVLPVDTVRAVVGDVGLSGEVRYRPSSATVLRSQASRLPGDQQILAKEIADGEAEPDDPRLQSLDDRSRADVLGLAYDALHLAFVAREVSPEEAGPRLRRILSARSRIGVRTAVDEAVPAPAVRPDEGHRTTRVAVGGGWRNDQPYLELRIRPAFQGLMDAAGGYVPGAQIEILELAGRINPDSGEARIEQLELVDIVSLSPFDRFFQPISWKVNAGLRTRLLPQDPDLKSTSALTERHVGTLHGGAGVAVAPQPQVLLYAFAEATFDGSPHLADDFAIGPGVSTGAFVGIDDRWKFHAFGKVTRYAFGDRSTYSSLGVEQRLSLSANTALHASISANRDFDRDWVEGGLALWAYF